MDSNFFQEKIMKYLELGIVLEDFDYKEKGKIYIPILLPEISGTAPIREKQIRGSVSNIKNKTGVNGIGAYEISNYVEMNVPGYIAECLKDQNNKIKKGTQLLIAFMAGEINMPVIVGVADTNIPNSTIESLTNKISTLETEVECLKKEMEVLKNGGENS